MIVFRIIFAFIIINYDILSINNSIFSIRGRMTNPEDLRNHLSFNYEELEELNLEAKERQARYTNPDELREHYL